MSLRAHVCVEFHPALPTEPCATLRTVLFLRNTTAAQTTCRCDEEPTGSGHVKRNRNRKTRHIGYWTGKMGHLNKEARHDNSANAELINLCIYHDSDAAEGENN